MSAGYSTDRLFVLDPPSMDVRYNSCPDGQKAPQMPNVFGWFHYVQDFSGEFASDWLERLSAPGDVVWDPFLGSGTTALAAMLLGRRSCGYDENPFMVEVARVKTDWSLCPDSLIAAADSAATRYSSSHSGLPYEPDGLAHTTWEEYESLLAEHAHWTETQHPKLAKWMSPVVMERERRLLAAINTTPCRKTRRFLRVAAASQLIPASNMKFRPNICYSKQPVADAPVLAMFLARAYEMAEDYGAVRDPQAPTPTILRGDARCDGPGYADVIFTSPPYPNDMEYVHQTRLELTLLSYAEDARWLTDLKKQMISSSVKLVYKQNNWQKHKGLKVASVRRIHEEIAKTLEGRGWGWNAADMIAHYFGGMQAVFDNWASRLRAGGRVGCVIGDSAFNGVKVPTDEILCELAVLSGFAVKEVDVFRSRWHNKHTFDLRESVLVLENV